MTIREKAERLFKYISDYKEDTFYHRQFNEYAYVKISNKEDLDEFCDVFNELEKMGKIHRTNPDGTLLGDIFRKNYTNGTYALPTTFWLSAPNDMIAYSHQGIGDNGKWVDEIYKTYYEKYAIPLKVMVEPEKHPEYFI